VSCRECSPAILLPPQVTGAPPVVSGAALRRGSLGLEWRISLAEVGEGYQALKKHDLARVVITDFT
jgi:hypothetical protein